MSTIISALQSATRPSSATSQLVLTRDSRLSKSERQILRQLEDLLDPQGDHRTYREALKSIKTPFAIPWLGAPCPSFPLHLPPFNAISRPPTQPQSLLRPQQRRRYRRPETPDQLQPLLAPTRAHRRGTALPRARSSRPARETQQPTPPSTQ